MQARHVLIADDQPVTREGLALATRAALPGIVIDNAGSIAEAEVAIRTRGDYRLVLLDFILPDAHGFSGLLHLQYLLGNRPIALVTARRDPALMEAARALGAAGFLSKTTSIDALACAIRAIAEGETIFPDGLEDAPSAATVRDRISTLSGAQLKVLLALADGRHNKEIANDLEITEATVKAHLTVIFRKLGVNNRSQALLAMQPVFGEVGEPAP